MSKIYQVFDSKSKKVVKEGFASRAAAKVVRNKLNNVDGPEAVATLVAGARYVVNRGADHPRGQSTGVAEQSKRWL